MKNFTILINFTLYYLTILITKSNCFFNLPLEDIFIIRKDNITILKELHWIIPQLIKTPNEFEYNLISITNLETINKTIEFNFEENDSIVFYFIIDNLNDLYIILNQIEIYETNTPLPVGIFKHIIKLFLHDDDDDNEIDSNTFKQILENKIQKLKFFQTNPILVHVITKKDEYCFVAYRIDNIETSFLVKEILKQPNDENCLKETVEGLIDSKISRDFGGAKLIVSAVNLPNVDYDVKINYTTNDEIIFESGFGVDVLDGMKYILNFTVATKVSSGYGRCRSYPNCDGPEKWDGAVGDVLAKNVDLVITSTSNVGLSKHVVDFNFATHVFSINAFFEQKCSYRSKHFPILSTFCFDLWMTIIVWIILNIIAYKFLKQFLCRECQVGKKDEKFQEGLGSWGFTTLIQQGSPDAPVHYTLRTLYFFQLLVSLVLYAGFSGTLVSFVSISRRSIDKLGDLLDPRYGFEFGIDPIIKDYADENIRIYNTSDHQLQLFKRSFLINQTISNGIFPVKRILKENLVYIIDEITGFREIMRAELKKPYERCWIANIPVFQSTQFQGSYVKKNSSLRRVIGYSILKMMETGNVNRWKKLHLFSSLRCYEDGSFTTMFVSVELTDINFAYLILGIGILLSVCLVLWEFYCSNDKIER